MSIKELREKWNNACENIRNGNFTFEGEVFDYKKVLNNCAEILTSDTIYCEKQILFNLGRDILSFANSNGTVIFFGILENKTKATDRLELEGYDDFTDMILQGLDCSKLKEQIESYTGYKLSFEKDMQRIANHRIGALIINKSEEVLVPHKSLIFGTNTIFKTGEVLFRDGDGNEIANQKTSTMNKFIQIKANEKSKDFMKIWSNLLPEMIDINPKQILMLNVEEQKVYGFNKNGNKLDGGKIEIDDKTDAFKIILESIQAGEIGKISNSEGKPIYRIVGDVALKGDPITQCVSNLNNLSNSKYSFQSAEFKKILMHLDFISDDKIKVAGVLESNKNKDITNLGNNYIFASCTNQTNKKYDLKFTTECCEKVLTILRDESNHIKVFGKSLIKKVQKKKANK